MSEFTEKLNEKLNDQYKQFNESVEKIAKAGKGLVTRVLNISSQQFTDLVAEGEKTDVDLLDQVRDTVKQPLSDIRGSVTKAKFASLGLFVKVKENSNRYFEELVVEGEKVDQPKPKAQKAAVSESKSSKAKAAVKAA